jgi:phage-related protein
MPRQVSLEMLIAKNNLEQDSPWLFLFDIEIDETTTLHLVNYPEAVVWNTITYTPYYLRMEPQKEQADGSMPQIKVMVSNVTREVESLLDANSGMRGKSVTITMVHKDDPVAGELTQQFIITESISNAQMATFTLEKAIPAFEIPLPRRVFTTDEFPGIQDRARYY